MMESKWLWEQFAKIVELQQPGELKWYEDLSNTHIVFAAMIDLHERMMEMEKEIHRPATHYPQLFKKTDGKIYLLLASGEELEVVIVDEASGDGK